MRRNGVAKISLLLGYGGLCAAIVLAYLKTARGYEVSIYAGTPLWFWVLSSFALFVSIAVVFSRLRRHVRVLGIVLAGLTMTTIVSLPIIRGYHYVGEGDSLSHLGIATALDAGSLAVTESPYPIVHVLGATLHDVTGLDLHHALLLLVVVFVVSFFVFVPLVVRKLTSDGWTTAIGFFSGLLLLPINHLAPSLYVHPTTQAIMYAPAFLFLFLLLYSQRSLGRSAMFLLLAITFVLLHPQQAANLVIFFGAIATMQIFHDMRRGNRLKSFHDWIAPEVALYMLVLLFWAANFDIFWQNLETVSRIPFGAIEVASSTVTRGASLTEAGGSLTEVFVKLFAVTLVYALLTGAFMILVVSRSVGMKWPTSRDSFVHDGGSDEMLPLYIYGGVIMVGLLFVLYLIGGISDQYFRHLGMLMVFGTILGAIALGRILRYVSHRWSRPAARRSIGVVVLLCIALSLPVVYPSPYIYDESMHVTEAQMEGYETTFEYGTSSMAFADVRSKTYRYGDASGMILPEAAYYRDGGGSIPDHFASHSLRTHYNESVHIPVTEADRIRDPVVWNGFRFNHEDFDYLDSAPGINKVQTNSGYDLYVVDPLNASAS